jgi:hypothetical protein
MAMRGFMRAVNLIKITFSTNKVKIFIENKKINKLFTKPLQRYTIAIYILCKKRIKWIQG